MPTIFDWMNRFELMRGLPAVYGVLLTAVLIIVIWDWRVTLLALAGQYLVAGLLFVDTLDPRLAIVKVLAGLFVCLILTMTAIQVNYGRLPVDVSADEVVRVRGNKRIWVGAYSLPTAIVFRLLAALIVLLAAWFLAQRPAYLLPALPAGLDYFNFAVFGLVGLGLLGLAVTADPLQAGSGLFMLMTGFELYYSVVEQSFVMLALMAGANVVLALVITYLIQAQHSLPGLVDLADQDFRRE